MSPFEPHRLGALVILTAAAGILLSALQPGWLPEAVELSALVLIAFVLVRYLALPAVFSARLGLRLIDRVRSGMLLVACILAALAIAAARQRRLPSFAHHSFAELAAMACPALPWLLPLVALWRMHPWIVRRFLWGWPRGRASQGPNGGVLAAGVLALAAPVLHAVAVHLASAHSPHWGARTLYAAFLADRPPRIDGGDLEAQGALLAELLWNDGSPPPGTKPADGRVRRRVQRLLGPMVGPLDPAATSSRHGLQLEIRKRIERRLGLQANVSLAALPPGEAGAAAATELFRKGREGALRPFVRDWAEEGSCDSPRPDLRQEWLWLLANLCHRTDAAAARASYLAVVQPWLSPRDGRWQIRGATWEPLTLPVIKGAVPADAARLLHEEVAGKRSFAEEVLGSDTSPPCKADRLWKVTHLWTPPPRGAGEPAGWAGAVAVARQLHACWADPRREKLVVRDCDRQPTRVPIPALPFVVIAKQGGPQPAGKDRPDLKTLVEIFGVPMDGICVPPAFPVTLLPAFVLQRGGR